METVQKHLEMVLRLSKPGQAILETLTAADCDLIHMGGCLAGEASELFEAIESEEKDAEENVLEELGDFQFYWAKNANIFHLERSPATPRKTGHPEVPRFKDIELATIRLMVLGGQFWDVVKRATVYRKPVETEKAVTILQEIEQLLLFVQRGFGYSLEKVLEANYAKLADKDKGRYSQGTYSDEQAQARRDKA